MTKISRREFFRIGAVTTAGGAAALAAQGGSTKKAVSGQAVKDEKIVKTTCALCPSGCGLDVRVINGKAVKVEGSALHPLNQGVCCLKGQASLEVLYSPERIKKPRLQEGKRSGKWKEISWDEALSLLSNKMKDLRAAGQAHTVALVHGDLRGQMRSLANQLMTAYGSPNVISRDSLGEQAARQAMFLMQGINGLPVYDLNNANYVMTFGGNLLESSRNVIAYLASAAFMRRGRPTRGKMVAVHPRLSLTAIKSDEWVPIRPGTYGALALGMANVIINSRLFDEKFVRDFTFGFEDFRDDSGNAHIGFKSLVLKEYTLERTSKITGVATDIIARLAGEFATNRPAVAVMPAEPGELASGNSLFTAMAIHALNALVGSIDQMGGVLVQRFPTAAEWPDLKPDAAAQAGLAQPRIDGAGGGTFPFAGTAYQNLNQAILTSKPYGLNLLILLNANPVYDLPSAGEGMEALLKVPFVVSIASTLDESAAHADLILPACTFMETWGDDYMEGTGYAGVSLRKPVVEPMADNRNPGDVLLDLASRLGSPAAGALPYKDYLTLVRHRLSKVGLDWQKFEENGFWAELIYYNAAPGSPAWANVVGRDRLNAPKDGRFDFYSRELFGLLKSGRDEDILPHFTLPVTLQEGEQDHEYPFLLISQNLITQSQAWQGIIPTMQEVYGLQGYVRWDSWVEINPRAAHTLGVKNGDRVWVESPAGRVQTQVRLFQGIWPNAVFMPAGQGHYTLVRWGRNAPDRQQVGANPNQLAYPATETLSGQAVFNPVRVKITKV